MPVGKPVPVGRVDDPGTTADRPLVDREQGDAVAVGDGGVQADGAGRGADLDQLAGNTRDAETQYRFASNATRQSLPTCRRYLFATIYGLAGTGDRAA